MQIFNFLNNYLLSSNSTFSMFLVILLSSLFYLIITYFSDIARNTKTSYINIATFTILNSSVFLFLTIFIHSIFSQLFIIVFSTICFFIIYKISLIKSILLHSIFSVSVFILESMLLGPIFKPLNLYYFDLIKIPLFSIDLLLCYYISLIATYFIARKLKITSITESNNLIDTCEIVIVYLINLFLVFEFLDIWFNYNTNNNYHFLLFFFFLLSFFYCMSISNMIKTIIYRNDKKKIFNLESYNKSISEAYDETRTFKHDSNNIFQAISGYITNNNFNGLKNYFWQVFPEIKNINNLSKLNPELINNPAVYGLLVEKHFRARNNNVNFNLDVLVDLNTLNIKDFELTRILGILVDNAIETAKECPDKIVNICFKSENNKQLLIVENTYANKEVCIDKIFEKGYSTKPNNTGLGLWEVRKILSRNSNLNLFTSKSDDYFMQQLEIY